MLLAKKQGEKCKWASWVALAGVFALITAAANVIRFFVA